MKVFISWSGDRSKALAEALRQWLPAVIQAVQPYYSPDDITKGARWSEEIAKVLEESRVGIICLTGDNLDAPWIMFEAGALSKKLERSRVSPILFGVEPTDLTGPLVQFQSSKFDKTDIKRLVRMINGELGDAKLASDVLDTVFDMWWPKLDEKVTGILAVKTDSTDGMVRSQQDLLEEILLLTRSQAHRREISDVDPQAQADLVEGYSQLVRNACALGITRPLADELQKLFKPISYIARRSRFAIPKGNPGGLLADLNEVKELLDASVADPIQETANTADDDDDLPF